MFSNSPRKFFSFLLEILLSALSAFELIIHFIDLVPKLTVLHRHLLDLILVALLKSLNFDFVFLFLNQELRLFLD